MAVLLKNGAVFLHIPKTGGSWVTKTLKQAGLVQREIGHIHADMVRIRYYRSGHKTFLRSAYEIVKSRIPRSVKSAIMTPDRRRRIARRENELTPFTFCFVRHPLRWYESWWRYMNGRSGSNWAKESDLMAWHPCAPIKHCGSDQYEIFIRNVVEQRPGFVSELYAQYAQPDVSFVGKQERLADDLVTVLEQMDIPFDEQQIRDCAAANVSHHDQSVEISEPLKNELERLEYAAMVRYRYSNSGGSTSR